MRLRLPDRDSGTGAIYKDKYVVVLQGGTAFEYCSDVAVLVASTQRGATVRPFEVLTGSADGFDHDTIIDCRWPYTLRKAEVIAGDYKFSLPSDRLREISLAMVHGLQLQ